MLPLDITLLIATVTLSAGRNLLSKNIADIPFGSSLFFKLQGSLFLSGALILTAFSPKKIPSAETCLLASVYALLLLSAQWYYTCALGRLDLSVCSTVYSLGFVIPTISGALFWNEPFTILDMVGLALVICAVILSGCTPTTEKKMGGKPFFAALMAAMIASGGLGIVQKYQQSSIYREERGQFVAIAFFIATSLSLAVSFFTNSASAKIRPRVFPAAILVGICFGTCNLLNTTLAGRLDSAVFFPLLNISVILLSTILNRTIYKVRFAKRAAAILLLSTAAIVLLNL